MRKQCLSTVRSSSSERSSSDPLGPIDEGWEDHDAQLSYEDPFEPLEDLPEDTHCALTLRAVAVGCFCGALVNVSNVYLGLKAGWTFAANLFGAFLGFIIIKPLSQTLSSSFPLLGGDFGPRENNIVQTTAVASGGLSTVFISAFPALYQLKLLDSPFADLGRIISLTAAGGLFGFFLGTALRRLFIVQAARELRLTFPTATATAITIRSMHRSFAKNGYIWDEVKVLACSFFGALMQTVASQYAVGLLRDWHVFTWIFVLGGHSNGAIAIESWGWFLEWTPALIGSGMLVGLNVAASFYGGSILAWGIIGPILVRTGNAFGVHMSSEKEWQGYMSYTSLNLQSSTKETPSPRYWLLWPGIACLLAVSVTELALQWRAFAVGLRAIYRACRKTMGKSLKRPIVVEVESTTAQAPEHGHISTWLWLPGLVVCIIWVCISMGLQFSISVRLSIISVILSILLSFLSIQCTGVTDITPLGVASKASQLVLAGASNGSGWSIARMQQVNLLGGALATIGANQATDLITDFRLGFLLRTSPTQQWLAQGLGTLFAVIFAPGVFVLFTTAYPCILDLAPAKCAFPAPAVASWRAVAIAVTAPDLPIPRSSGIFAIAFATFGCFMTIVREKVWTGRLEWIRAYHPNMMCLSLAFILPQTTAPLAMLIGASGAAVWAKRSPKSHQICGYALAAGLIAGEGIGGVFNAILQIAGVSGEKHGTQVGCPAGVC